MLTICGVYIINLGPPWLFLFEQLMWSFKVTIRKNRYLVPTVYVMGNWVMAQEMTNGTLDLSVLRSPSSLDYIISGPRPVIWQPLSGCGNGIISVQVLVDRCSHHKWMHLIISYLLTGKIGPSLRLWWGRSYSWYIPHWKPRDFSLWAGTNLHLANIILVSFEFH